MAKIGILTYYAGNNNGTFLQSYSLLKAISDRFNALNDSVEIIAYRNHRAPLRPNFYHITPAEWYRDVIRIIKLFRAHKEYMRYSAKHLYSNNPEKAWRFMDSLGYDAIIVGADTCLEMFRAADESSVTAFWLPKHFPCLKYFCAASARETEYEGLSASQRKLMKDSAAGFQLFGVRDRATCKLFINLGIAADKVFIIPDPTFSYIVDYAHAERYWKNKNIFRGKPIAALHLPRHFPWAHRLADLFRSNGYTVISFRPCGYADACMQDMSPMEWAGIFKYMDVMITHRFHDSIFAFKNGIPLVSVLPTKNDYMTKDGDSKLHTLHQMFGLGAKFIIEDHKAVNASAILSTAIKAIEEQKQDIIRKKAEELREKFEDYVNNLADHIHSQLAKGKTI